MSNAIMSSVIHCLIYMTAHIALTCFPKWFIFTGSTRIVLSQINHQIGIYQFKSLFNTFIYSFLNLTSGSSAVSCQLTVHLM